jgi:GT2 family glycosyltransferase
LKIVIFAQLLMVQLSVIIVNYNVKYFLEQALLSVQKASEKLSVEVFVVDNNSSDDSVEMVKNNFPSVHLIDNQQNTGFSVANNQAYALAKGKYILLLNPDTVVAEDTFQQCYDFMEENPTAGALGVRMIDGSGVFLPESKRGFPSPFVAFCKTFGLSSFFPKSRVFNQYYLGHKGEWETCEIEVLAGAFMFMRKEALEKVGMLDEAFFMYGEDIDLSYRIVKGGYKNYYLPTTSILHYKGESTKKGSLNYVKTFYQAMIIFAKKHFSGSQGQFFVAMLQVAIYLRAFITLFSNFLKTWSLPMIDATMLFVGMYFLKDYWAISRFGDAQYYQSSLLYFNVPLYIIGWLSSVYFNGGYDKNANAASVVKGLSIGALLLMAIYGLLPSEYRSSRMLLLLGSVWAMVAMLGLRFLGHFLQHKNFNFTAKKEKNLAIIAQVGESNRVRQLMFQAQVQKNFIGTISPDPSVLTSDFIGTIAALKNLVEWYRIDELIFCSKDIRSEQIIRIMSEMGSSIAYRIVPEGSNSIIGSSSKNEVGELYNTDIQFNISTIAQQRNKRLFDILSSCILLIISPLVIFFIKNKLSFLPTIIQVFFGKKTWIGYGYFSKKLPKIAEGVLSPSIFLSKEDKQISTIERLDFFYAKDYHVSKDIFLLLKNWRKI